VPFSIVAVDLTAGARAGHLADRQVLSASLYKLFVAHELIRRVRAGTLSAEAPARDGNGRSVGTCITDMIVVSDDQCGVAGLRLVGGGALDASLAGDGYAHTRLASPQRTSASDVALFLQRTHDAAATDPASGQLYDLLRRQQVNDRFPLGLPAGTPIAHKTGDRIGWAHDAGIITTPHGEALLVVLSGPWASPCCKAERPGPAERAAFAALADVARRVYALYA
jgi:beta-lactamase class A